MASSSYLFYPDGKPRYNVEDKPLYYERYRPRTVRDNTFSVIIDLPEEIITHKEILTYLQLQYSLRDK